MYRPRTKQRHHAWILSIALGAVTASSARAQPSAQDKALATALFKEARQLLTEQQVDKACRKFHESQRIDPSGGTLLNLAACHDKQGRTASAWTEYHEALAWARRDGRTDRINFALNQVQALEPRLSYIIVSVPPEAMLDGIEIRRDGSPLRRDSWGSRMPMDPGLHVIEASAPGHQAWRGEITLPPKPTEQRVVVPTLVPEREPVSVASPMVPSVATPIATPIATPSPSPERPATSSSAPWAVIALGSIGVAGLGVGSYFGLRAISKNNQADDACPDNHCSTEGLVLEDEAGNAADVSTVAFTVGLVALGAGVTVWLLDSEEPASTLAPSVGPRSAGLNWSTRF